MNGAIQIFLDRVADAPLAKSQITITRAEADAIAAVVKQRHGPMTEPEFWQQAYIAHVRRGTLGPATLATSAVDAYRGRYGEQAVVSAMPECPQVCEPAEPTPDEPDPEPTAAVPERKEMEWEWEWDGTNFAWIAQWTAGTWRVQVDETGRFLVSDSGYYRDAFSTLAAAKAWCQEQDDKLLAEREGKGDGR